MNIESALVARAQESGLSSSLLRTVYLRGVKERGGDPTAALRRVDGFILYALVRDTAHSRDRDLVVFL